jgi:hypothetical protein
LRSRWPSLVGLRRGLLNDTTRSPGLRPVADEEAQPYFSARPALPLLKDEVMQNIIDIYLQPSKVFAAQGERPTFLVPLLFLVALTALLTVTYFWRVDPAWYADLMMESSGGELSASEREQMRQMMPGTHVIGSIATVTGILALIVVTVLTGVYAMVVGKFVTRPLTFRHGMSLATWSSMPAALGLMVAMVGALTMSGDTSLESLMLTNVDPLVVELPKDHQWNGFAQSFSILSFWSVFLFALGWKVWTRSSWLQAALVSVVPTALIAGSMGLMT